jgi:hypothetical protein
VNRQRLELSDRIRASELFAYVEIGPNILSPKIEATTKAIQSATRPNDGLSMLQRMDAALDALGTANTLVYATNRPTAREVRDFIQSAVSMPVYSMRMAQANLPAAQVMPLLTPPQVLTYGLTKRAADGSIQPSTREKEVIAMLIPIGLLILMFMVVMVGASPLTVNLVEEKQLRIAEVLLGSVRPFELMMGKLLGGVGVALTLAVVYFSGVYYLARQYNVSDAVSPSVMMWFAVFTVLATLMYGAMFIAAGSAVTNVKEAQSMLMPVMLLIEVSGVRNSWLMYERNRLLSSVASRKSAALSSSSAYSATTPRFVSSSSSRNATISASSVGPSAPPLGLPQGLAGVTEKPGLAAAKVELNETADYAGSSSGPRPRSIAVPETSGGRSTSAG